MKLLLPDGKELIVENGASGRSIAKQIAISLEKKALAFSLNGQLYDIDSIIEEDGQFAIITDKSIEAADLLNHSTSHLLAQALKNLYPEVKFGFGPAIDEGFYYDIDLDVNLTESDLANIEKEMHRLAKENFPIVRKELTKKEALEVFKDNPYKIELIEGIDDQISVYSQGDFVDLCHGPHVPSTGFINHFKLLSVAGAYWRGDSKNKMLTRIYGTSFYSEEALQQHLLDLEERKKRDHRKIGKDLGLFMLSDYGPGLPFFLPNGYTLRRNLEDFWIDLHKKNGYVVVDTPIMLSRTLWETSGHWDHYHEDMFTTKVEEEDYAIKPMNCPGAILVYKNDLHSYRDLPMRIAELGHVHRNEASGALNGLFRVRSFTQDDAHTLLTEDQIEEEISNILKIYDHIYSIFGLDYHIELSTRPEDNFIGDIETWNRAEDALAKACKATGRSFKINPGDGAFYGPKLDFKLKDSMNRIWQCGTVQLDMQLPGRFDCTYVAEDGSKKTPVMIHRACFGSIERFIGIITENFAGAFPTWCTPVQINLCPVKNDLHLDFCKELKAKFEQEGFRVKIDSREEKIGYRMRESQMMKIPYTLVIGDNEKSTGQIAYRKYGNKDAVNVSLEDFIKLVKEEIKSKALLVTK
ncbi:MAG: threonine--tRNA ligase [Bacilli bacterium]|nr:threonine--tRNA ligase [Bacilli bacterium]